MSDLQDGSLIKHFFKRKREAAAPEFMSMSDEAITQLSTLMSNTPPVIFRAVRTRGDGCCAIHSVFGHLTKEGDVFLPDARKFIVSMLGPSINLLSSSGARSEHVQSIEACMWSELVCSVLCGKSSVEGRIFWQALQLSLIHI